MTTYRLLPANGNIVFKMGNEIIMVDTGCPFTFGQEHPMLSPESRKFIGQEVTRLWGNDTLRKYKVLIDVPNGEITLDTNPIPFKGTSLEFSPTCDNHLQIKAQVNGVDRIIHFDTGAPISYVDPSWIVGHEKQGVKKDFSPDPNIGYFESTIYGVVPMSFGGYTIDAELWVPPERVLDMSRRHNALGVVGGEIFKRFKVYIDYSNRVFMVGK